MKRTTRNLITAVCCTTMMAAIGCSNTGELTVTGMYGSQGQALSGDQCDELLMGAADADTAEEQEAAKAEYRECVENALEENGQHGECRDDNDETCDIILDEISDVVHRLREDGDTDQPECADPSTAGEEALCHLVAAYEACELDQDDDGDPDVEQCDEDGANCPPRPDECEDAADGRCHPEPDDCTDPDGNDVCDPVDTATCEQIRDHAEGAGPDDREFLERERPECFDANTDPDEPNNNPDEPNDNPDEPNDNPDEPNDTPDEPNDAPDQPTDAEAFCAELAQEIDAADGERKLDLQELYERECVQ